MVWLAELLAAAAVTAAPAPAAAPSTGAEAAAAPLTGVPARGAADSCVACHAGLAAPALSGPVAEVRESVHADPAISCAGCHGGDPRIPTARAHDDPSFVARPDAPRVVRMCGSCHSDAAFIRDFDAALRVDQLALYRKSAHGKALAAGDFAVATCISCHGAHRIRKIDDADSPVRAENVAATCGKCHADPRLTAAHEMRGDVVEKWRSSVHAAALAKGDRSAPTCNDCHGNHGARPPAVASIHRVCGACHSAEAEMFAASVHAGPFTRLGLGECVECHSNHAIEHPRPSMVGGAPDSACSRCHAPGTKGAGVAVVLRARLDESAGHVATAEAAVADARRRGVSTPEASALLAELQDALLRLPAQLHTMDGVKFGEAAGAVAKTADDVVQSAGAAVAKVAARRRGYALSLVLIALLMGLLVLKVRRLDRLKRTPPA